ncbi:hypothetical protein PROPHIT501_57 [Mycobacterium phage prophiT50-1]|nr:hypothetical protein PROPHIT501_57 [Mycobacterium phage prophiT50-1]
MASRAYGPEFDEWRQGAQKAIAALDSTAVALAQHGYAFQQTDGSSALGISGV